MERSYVCPEPITSFLNLIQRDVKFISEAAKAMK